MSTLIIGDFRGKQLQQSNRDAITFDCNYLVEDTADCVWFNDSAIKQLPHFAVVQSSVIIMLGLNDCILSCAWKTFNINNIITNYSNAINKLIEQYPDLDFYFCSINPVDADYPFAEYKGGAIPMKTLNKQIETFNDGIKTSCSATYIDCYDYLTNTGFNTRDGIRYTQETCLDIIYFLMSKARIAGGNAFLPRLSMPITASGNDDYGSDLDLYWVTTSSSGLSTFSAATKYNKSVGDTLPNATAYAWGRFYEILGSKPNLSTASAGTWFTNTGDGYRRGNEPALGAIACWSQTSGTGHVAVVEQINADGSIITSESALQDSRYWWLTTRNNSNGNWGQATTYKFQGFIYCPTVSTITKEQLCTKNSYSITIEEMKPNAQYIWQYFSKRGWTMNAVAGLLGNLQVESKMSPIVWESLINGSISTDGGTEQVLNLSEINAYYNKNSRYPGYGLVQWTPYSKFTDWCASNNLDYWDIDSQLQRIDWEAKNKKQWIAKPAKGYELSFDDFITSTKDAYWLAGAFAFCYERPGSSTGSAADQANLKKERGEYGSFWYAFLNSLPPISADTSPQLANFKLTSCLPTSAVASFMANNIAVCKYTLTTGAKTVSTGTINNLKNESRQFSINNLVPNTSYKLTIEVAGEEDVSSKLKKELDFTTPQDHPYSVKDISLTPVGVVKANGLFNLKVTKPESTGYWSKNKNGYEEQLIINHKCVKTKTVSGIKNISSKEIDIKNEFGYTCKPGDLLQIGIRVWVTDDAGVRVYDNQKAKTSDSICLLNNAIRPYLKID